MMSYSKFLDYEVTLLLAKYGESAVLGALAKQLGLTPKQLEALLESPPARKPSIRPTKGPLLGDLVNQLAQEHPDKAEALRQLQSRLENRTFLAELKDVRRFVDRHGSSLGSAQSRNAALPKVLKLLAELNATELEELCQTQPEASRSSLGMISDEILRRGHRD